MAEPLFLFKGFAFGVHALPVMAVGALIFLIGLLILFQTRRAIRDIAFFFFCMAAALWLFTMGFVYSAPDAGTALRLYKTLTFFGVVNLTPNLYLFAACVSGLLAKQKGWVILTYLITYGIYFMSLVTDRFITTPHLYFWGYYPRYEPWNYLFLLTFAVVFFANQAHLKLACAREAVPVKKQQIRFIKLSLLFGVTAFIDFVAKIWVVPVYPAGFISMFILVCLLAYSIIRYKAFDIETVIHKTVLWVASFSLILIPIFLVYRLYFPFIRDSGPGQIFFGVVSFLVFAVYLREFQPRIDHFFQRRKADLESIARQFTGDLVHLKDFDSLVRLLEETLAGALYPQWVDIFIYDEKQGTYNVVNPGGETGRATQLKSGEFLRWLTAHNRIAHRKFVEIDPVYAEIKDDAVRYFEDAGALVAIPLILGERLLGVINLGKKANLKRYNALDFAFLTGLKNQSAIAISNSLIYLNIEEQVKARTRELVEVQKQLIQAEKLATVGTLSGGVAHEINNPLTAILTNVQMLLAFSGEGGAGADRESLELIEEATQRCRGIVQKLMAYAKKPLESEQSAATDLAEVLRKTVAFISFQLEQEGVQIVVDAAPGHYFVMGNNNELEQVLTNFILNARDAIRETKKQGRVSLVLSRGRGQVRVKISDDGSGIPPNVLPKIFDPFFTTKDVGKGLGLGLSICQSIVEKYNGKITVESVLQEGTSFTVEFPEYAGDAGVA